MAADIVERTNVAILGTHQNDRLVADRYRKCVAAIGNILGESDAHPATRKQAGLLQLEKRRIGIGPAGQANRGCDGLLQPGDGFRAKQGNDGVVGHGMPSMMR